MLRRTKTALTPQPPLPRGEGEKDENTLLFPSPSGRGARGEGLRSFCVISATNETELDNL